MNTIEIYCKANKRNRDGKTISVCAHIIKEDEYYKEDAYTIEIEGNGIKLELAAIVNALLDVEAEEKLNKDKTLNLYIHNEYILKTLMKWEASTSFYQEEEKYTEQWHAIGELLAKCKGYKAYGLEKKYRDEANEEVVKYMAHINRMVCNRVNNNSKA